jgi:flagellar hook-associated protein 2
MSDVYMPGVKSRFNSDKIIEDLMKLERIPKDRVERNVENLQTQKTYWQEVGRRINAVRESSRTLYSFQNPFSERIAVSANEGVISALATREASERSYNFTVKQTAASDRFLSAPLDEKMKIEAGNYTFSVGDDEFTINFRGGTLKDFVDVINRRGRDKIAASLLTVQVGTKSLLIESKITGEANRLGFSGDTNNLLVSIGMMEQGNDTRRDFPINTATVKNTKGAIDIAEGVLQVKKQSQASIPMGITPALDSNLVIKFETSTKTESGDSFDVPPPTGPVIPSSSITYGGITIENEPSLAPLAEPPEAPQRIDNMAVLNFTFSDGSSEKLPAISDSNSPVAREYRLADFARGRTIVSFNIENTNTHREIFIGKVEVTDPAAINGGLLPVNPVSLARDAVFAMEGIEMKRPNNNVSDIIPGVSLNIKGESDRPVQVKVGVDTEGVKEALINFVGNYNRLMAEVNILTRNDTKMLDELTYLTNDEKAEMKQRLGAFTGDTTLNSFKNNLQRTISAPYPTSLERELTLLSQIGISTNARNRGGGYDPSQLRGYLEIDEKILDHAIENKLMGIKQLFASDTTGDLIMDTGIAVNIDTLVKPFVETSGIISLKTNTIDSRIKQDTGRIDTMERQLAAKEQELKIQYARMEGAYMRMEQLSNSLDNFSQQNRGNR